jgi:hypothetical protein
VQHYEKWSSVEQRSSGPRPPEVRNFFSGQFRMKILKKGHKMGATSQLPLPLGGLKEAKKDPARGWAKGEGGDFSLLG